ncbi:cx9C motif-containing protein 4 [Callorhinchus milii]|uniref:Mature T-cell proliferation 1 neighbor protein-like protein n=1 Tax=Callorhinchus milii TaxID=7868 RepID=V9LIU4_CALMI|nr:cx9C motif-containing protein 4 [Callorhinchus milii]XP_042196687.1 cx9C motif-containing protein 4 [Callorhinchus milii]XP_042196688.1 cx9C motif-containing protein 4 [Callorhinchus milii]|eukprot:gi/632935278/ref/XP_007889519.1/ PREDICTED: cx9C motif-containing protein 4 [Callorhinchus milii]
MSTRDPCQTQACEIQKCLQAYHYQESKCQHVIEEMHKCCKIHAKRSVCCSGFLIKQEEKNKQFLD